MSEDQNVSENEMTPLDEVENKPALNEENIASLHLETVNSHPENENMEVHHHPDLHHNKKNFREYFLEFIMIFLAVTMGFIAENVRENITDHARAKEYARSLYDDLKKDTSWLNLVLNVKAWRGSKFDSLISILESGDVQKNSKLIYYYNSFLTVNLPLKPNDVTIQQLRNSGGFRYIKNPELYNVITTYYNDCDFVLEREKENTLQFPFDLSSKLFQSDVVIASSGITPDILNSVFMPDGNPQLLTLDKQLLNKYLLYVGAERKANDLSIYLLKTRIKEGLKNVMATLQKEYNVH